MNDETIDKITNDSNVSAAINFARTVTEPRVVKVTFEDTEEEVLLTSTGDGAVKVNPVRDLFAAHARVPERRKGTIIVHDLASFVALVNRDSGTLSSVIFADVPARKLTAVLDFHQKDGGDAQWGQDRIEYGFQLSPQLKAWLDASRSPMDQKTFARLIDDRLGDIGDDPPNPSIARDFAARRGIRLANIVDLAVFTRTIAAKSTTESEEILDENTGDVSIQYKKRGDVKTNDGKPIAAPLAFALKIPILCGKEATEFYVAVRLRYDISEKGIAWRVELHALEKYLLAAIEEALDKVREDKPAGCGLDVFMGAAPA